MTGRTPAWRRHPRWFVPTAIVAALGLVAGLVAGVQLLVGGWGDGTSGGTTTTAYTGSSAVSRVQVSMASPATATALGVHGTVFSMSRADGSGAAGQVHVSVSYASFADAYGGGYASRLRLVELPACAITTPQVAACRKQTPVPSGAADNVKTDQVGADVAIPGTSTTSAIVSSGITLTALIEPDASPAGGVPKIGTAFIPSLFPGAGS